MRPVPNCCRRYVELVSRNSRSPLVTAGRRRPLGSPLGPISLRRRRCASSLSLADTAPEAGSESLCVRARLGRFHKMSFFFLHWSKNLWLIIQRHSKRVNCDQCYGSPSRISLQKKKMERKADLCFSCIVQTVTEKKNWRLYFGKYGSRFCHLPFLFAILLCCCVKTCDRLICDLFSLLVRDPACNCLSQTTFTLQFR